MAELYSAGKKANRETMDEIIAGLEAMGNYIPTSEATRREYRNVLMKEYKEFIETHDRIKKDDTATDTPERGSNE